MAIESILNKIKGLDQFSRNISFRMYEDDKYKSIFGGFVTIILIALVGF